MQFYVIETKIYYFKNSGKRQCYLSNDFYHKFVDVRKQVSIKFHEMLCISFQVAIAKNFLSHINIGKQTFSKNSEIMFCTPQNM